MIQGCTGCSTLCHPVPGVPPVPGGSGAPKQSYLRFLNEFPLFSICFEYLWFKTIAIYEIAVNT
jgi:hypothetical protein